MPRLCESPMKRRSRQGMEEDKVYQRLPMVWPRPSSLPDDAETRHHCSVSSALHIMPFLSMIHELLPPPSSLNILQTPHSLYVSNVVASGLKRTHAFSEETVKKKKQSVIKTSAYIFLGYTTKKKSRGRSISSLLSTQVAKKIRYQV